MRNGGDIYENKYAPRIIQLLMDCVVSVLKNSCSDRFVKNRPGMESHAESEYMSHCINGQLFDLDIDNIECIKF